MNSNKSTKLLTDIESRLDDMFAEIKVVKTVHRDVFSKKNVTTSSNILKERIKNAKASANEKKKTDRKE